MTKLHRFQFDSRLDFQLRAIQDSVNVFNGLPPSPLDYHGSGDVVLNLPPTTRSATTCATAISALSSDRLIPPSENPEQGKQPSSSRTSTATFAMPNGSYSVTPQDDLLHSLNQLASQGVL